MKLFSVLGIMMILGLAGCATVDELFEKDQEIPLSEVPAPVLAAAQSAVEGIVLTDAEVEVEKGQIVYELEGTAGGKEYEIEVAADGKVLEVEQDADDDDDHDHDDDD